MNSDKINKYAEQIHAQNVAAGWWPDGRCLFEVIQLYLLRLPRPQKESAKI